MILNKIHTGDTALDLALRVEGWESEEIEKEKMKIAEILREQGELISNYQRPQKVFLLLLCQMRDIYSMSMGNTLAPTGTNHYNAQLELSDKSRAIKGLVACYVVWLGSIKGMVFRTTARWVGLVPCFGQDCYKSL